MLNSSFTLLKVRGITIGAHWSWLAVLALVVWSLAGSAFPSSYPGLAESSYLVMGLVAGVLFFTSILLHELGHAFQAQREGMEIDGITLWFLGGVARFKGMFESAGAEFRIAIAGPVVSIVVAAVFGALTLLGDAVGLATSVQGVVDYLWRINAIVAGFNLVPALPLDGGRILRAWLWHRQGHFPTATRSAARAGTAFGWLLALVGVGNMLSGSGGGGLWFVFLGWFLVQAAKSEASLGVMQGALAGRKVRDVMTPDPESVSPEMTVADFLDRVVGTRGHSVYPVVEDGKAIGILPLRAAGQVEQMKRPWTTVREVMISDDRLTVVDADDDVMDVLADIHAGIGRAPVNENDRTVGLVSVADIERTMETQAVMGADGRPVARSAGVLVWAVVAALMLGVAGYLYRPPTIVLKPGKAIDVAGDIAITGVPTDDVKGKYLLTSITVSRPTGWGLVWAMVRGDEIVAREQVVPPDIPAGEYFEQQRAVFDESRDLAAAAAAQATGLDVEVGGSGASVLQVIDGSPADGVIRAGETVVAIDGEPIQVINDLQNAIRAEPVGHTFEVELERDGRTRTVTITSEQLSGAPDGTPGLGVVIETRGFNIDLPFEVDFKERDIGGPSAGLIYALVIADMLDPDDLSDGRIVAATGSIAVDGSIGDIGGVDLKARAAVSAGATIFFVPSGQAGDVDQDGLVTRGVADLEQALRALEDEARS